MSSKDEIMGRKLRRKRRGNRRKAPPSSEPFGTEEFSAEDPQTAERIDPDDNPRKDTLQIQEDDGRDGKEEPSFGADEAPVEVATSIRTIHSLSSSSTTHLSATTTTALPSTLPAVAPIRPYPLEGTTEQERSVAPSAGSHPWVRDEEAHRTLPGAERVDGYGTGNNMISHVDDDTAVVGGDDLIDEARVAPMSVRHMANAELVDDPRNLSSIPATRRGSSSMQLARANLVDDAQPIFEALNVESELRQRKRRNRLSFALVLLVCVAIVIAAAVASSRQPGASSGPAEDTPPPDRCDTVPQDDFLLQCECLGSLQEGFGRPDPTEWELRGQIVRALQHESVLAEDFLTNSSIDLCEPRNQAVWWIVQSWNAPDTVHEQTPHILPNGTIAGEEKKRLFIDRFLFALLFLSLNGRMWKENKGWLNRSLPYCEWFGISCQSREFPGSIDEMHLSDNNLNGTLPSEFARMSYIRRLDLDKNPLMRGTFPAEILDILTLKVVLVSGNGFEGPIGDVLPTMPTRSGLVEFKLDGNKFTGTLPSEYGIFPRLERLEVGKNRLQGTIPTELGQLQALEFLFLEDNEFRGTLPTGLFNLQFLEQLDVSGNMLTGPLPTSAAKALRLRLLDVSNNSFTGENPAFQYCREVDALRLIYVDCTDFVNTDANGFCGNGLDQSSTCGAICVCIDQENK